MKESAAIVTVNDKVVEQGYDNDFPQVCNQLIKDERTIDKVLPSDDAGVAGILV